MGYKYCVFGAGRQGVAAIYDLVKFCEADSVIVYEPDDFALAADRLDDLLGDDRDKVYWVETLDDRRTQQIDWKAFDVMISCAPWKANLELTEFAVRWGVPFCDLGGHPDTVGKQESLEPKTAVVPDCGLSPGVSNILAVHLAKRGCNEIRVRCGGIPLRKFDNGLNYRLTFDPTGLVSEYSGDVPVIKDGVIRLIPALSVVSPCGDTYECSPTSNNSLQIVETLCDLGVLNYNYMTIRYKGHWDLVRGWKAAGFLSGDDQADLKLAQVLEKNQSLKYNPEIHADKVILSVMGNSGEGSLRVRDGFDFTVLADPDTRFSAMELMTSWGATMVAHYMVKNPDKTPNGFATPERFVPGDWVLNGLRKRLS